MSGCSLLFDTGEPGGDPSDASSNDGASGDGTGEPAADADHAAPDANTEICAPGTMVTLTVIVDTSGPTGQLALPDYGGVFCNTAMGQCEFAIPCLNSVRLYATPSANFAGFGPVLGGCPVTQSATTMTPTMIADCTVQGFFGETPI